MTWPFRQNDEHIEELTQSEPAITKPTIWALQEFIVDGYPLPYSYVNWWAQQKGSEHRIYGVEDKHNPFYVWAWARREEIAIEMLGMVEGDVYLRFNELLKK